MYTGVIYKATCLINNKSYIGQTNNFKRRKCEHLRSKDDCPFHRAIRKHGVNSFIWEILEECDTATLMNEREKYWIDYYDTYKRGYNCSPGGENNTDALLKWNNEHPEQRMKNLEKMHNYYKNHRDEQLAHLNAIRQSGTEASKKSVRCIELNLIFDSLSDAERWSISNNNPNGRKSSVQHISRVCRGQRKTCGGYHWEYVK